MNNKEQFKRLLNFFSSLVLLSGFGLMLLYVLYTFYYDETILYRKGNWLAMLLYILVTAVILRMYDSYKVWYLKKEDIIYSQIISLVCSNFIEYLQLCLINRKFISVPPMLLLTVAEIVFSILWTIGFSNLFLKLYPPRKMILVYDGSQVAQTLVEKMSLRSDKYIICKAVCVSTGFDNVIIEIDEYDSIIVCDIDSELKSQLIKYCFQKNKRVYLTPSISDILIRGADNVTLFDTPLILCRNKGLSFEQRLFKRTMDILVSAIALIPLSVVMLFCAIAIKLEDGGKVLYKQVRLTENGRKFNIYKFRSMIENAEANGPQLAKDNDSRITKVGAVLRKYRLDELPQLFNILKGDMSLIGPRPERPELTEEYSKTMPEFTYRLHVKAGLTGYAQVIGRYDTTPYDKLKLDLMYIENYSILLDIRICFMTLKIILFPVKTNAEELGE